MAGIEIALYTQAPKEGLPALALLPSGRLHSDPGSNDWVDFDENFWTQVDVPVWTVALDC